jgi:hypothetical protein
MLSQRLVLLVTLNGENGIMRETDDRETQDFYEAMPGTMDSSYLTNDEPEDTSEHSILPWLLVPALALLSIILLSAGSNSNVPSGAVNSGSSALTTAK